MSLQLAKSGGILAGYANMLVKAALYHEYCDVTQKMDACLHKRVNIRELRIKSRCPKNRKEQRHESPTAYRRTRFLKRECISHNLLSNAGRGRKARQRGRTKARLSLRLPQRSSNARCALSLTVTSHDRIRNTIQPRQETLQYVARLP